MIDDIKAKRIATVTDPVARDLLESFDTHDEGDVGFILITVPKDQVGELASVKLRTNVSPESIGFIISLMRDAADAMEVAGEIAKPPKN